MTSDVNVKHHLIIIKNIPVDSYDTEFVRILYVFICHYRCNTTIYFSRRASTLLLEAASILIYKLYLQMLP